MLKFKILKTYFLEIMFLFTIAILSTIIMLSWFLSTHFERYTSSMVNTLNQEFLAENHRMNDYLQKIVKISGMELFLEPSVQKIMYQEELSNFDIVTGIRRLDAVMSTNLHTHSIYVYNAAREYIYATSNMDSDPVERFKDQGALTLLSGNYDHRRLAPIPRYIPSPAGDVPAYSFVFYTIQGAEPRIHGALIMNISLEWLREAFRDTEESTSSIMFVDVDGTVAYHSDTKEFLQNISDQPMFMKMATSDQANGYFRHRDSTGDYFVFFSKSPDSPLYLMRIFPYKVIMEGIIDVRMTTLFLIFLCVLIALFLSFLASRRLYKPIHQLVSRVGKNNKEMIHRQGELTFLSTSIDRMLDQAESTATYKRLLQVDILREILLGRAGDQALVEQQFNEYNFPFSLDIPLQLLAMKPCDETILFDQDQEDSSMKMLGVPFEGNTLMVLAQHRTGVSLERFCHQMFDKGVRLIIQHTDIDHPHLLGERSQWLLEELRFSFLYPARSVLNAKNLLRTMEGGVYPSELEKNLVQLLRQGKASEAFDCYGEFFSEISKNTFTHFRFSLKRLYISIQLLIKELQGSGCFSEYHEMGISRFEAFIESLETKVELDELFFRWFREFDEEYQRCRAERVSTIVTHIKQIVEAEYGNPNLCMQMLADNVHLSASYISKLFKETEGISLSDYWLERRMREASRQLAETDTLVKEIALSVGFVNENYFFTVFKKHFNMTPNEYRRTSQL